MRHALVIISLQIVKTKLRGYIRAKFVRQFQGKLRKFEHKGDNTKLRTQTSEETSN